MNRIIITFLFFSIASCCTRYKTTTVSNDDQDWKNRKYVAGEIFKPKEFAGCDYLIKLEGGKNLEPINLHDSLKRNNVKVWLRYHSQKEMMSVCMMGEIVVIDDIQYRK